jgi:hypothetical protein
MSESTLYAVFETTSHFINEYRNARWSAPVIWDELAVRYLGKPNGMGFGESYDDLWKLARDQRVPEHFRIALAMTFDDMLVAHVNVEAAARACCMVGDSLINSDNHWGAIGQDLWSCTHGKPHHRMVGYALNVTSVEDTWRNGIRKRNRDRANLCCAVTYARAILR